MRKKDAKTIRDMTVRASCVKFTFCCSVASGSLELCYEPLLWTRRFLRDHPTLFELHSVVNMRECLDLLSGVPSYVQSSITLENVQKDVKTGNKLILFMLETACLALQEPSFQPYHWNTVFRLFSDVTNLRLKQSMKLQQALSLSDEAIYDTLLVDTLNLLLEAESIGLEDANQGLNFCQQSGPAEFTGMHHDKLSPPILRFFDELARRREEMWRKHRRSTDPSVTILSPPWPRGLPIQKLLPFDIRPAGTSQHMPCLFSRAQSIVLVNGDVALADIPQPLEVQEAIGSFIDDYLVALRFYVRSHREGTEQKQAIRTAWHHALTVLSRDRMTHLEAQLYWQRVFVKVDCEPEGLDIQLPKYCHPQIPETMDPEEPLEWNPDPDPENRTIQPRPLPLSCLDCMVNVRLSFLNHDQATIDRATASRDKITEEMAVRRSRTVIISRKSDWQHDSPRSLPCSIQEGLIATGILFIDSKASTGAQVLSLPFPHATEVRYPALFLEDDFLDRKDLASHFGNNLLKTLLLDVPPLLLLQLCEKIFDKSEKMQKDAVSLSGIAFRLLQLLIKADKPWKALNLVRHVVLDRPNDSSQHRTFFCRRLLKRLPTQKVKDLNDLAIDMVARLQEQANQNPSSKDNKAPLLPFVKVSTIKMLAQVLSNAEFIDDHIAVDILISLLDNGKHLDIRLSIIESLADLLRNSQDKALIFKIIAALEQHAIPIAAAVNERQPMATEDWRRAEVSGELPEVTNYVVGLNLVQLMMQICKSHDEVLSEIVMNRIILPMVYRSSENNHRWLSMFMKQFSRFRELPQIPVQPAMLVELLCDHIELLPYDILEMLSQNMLRNLASVEEPLEISKTITGSHELRSSNAGKHWLFIWHDPSRANLTARRVMSKLTTKFDSKLLRGGINYQDLQLQIMKVIMYHVETAVDSFDRQDELYSRLSPPYNDDEASWRTWSEQCKPLIKRIIQTIDDTRTHKWQRDPDRRPAILKDTYQMKLWILTYPQPPNPSNHVDRFVKEISSGVEALAVSKAPYHHHLSQLLDAIRLARADCHVAIACKLGRLDLAADTEEPTLADWLRVELASEILCQASLANAEERTIEQVRLLVDRWQNSQFEEIRMRGLRTRKSLKKWLKTATDDIQPDW